MADEQVKQHTAGPWQRQGLKITTEGALGYIALVGESPTSYADSRLIAAAPELLAVAHELVEIEGGECLFDILNPCTLSKVPGQHWGSEPGNPVEACCVCKAIWAIAKAEGRSADTKGRATA